MAITYQGREPVNREQRRAAGDYKKRPEREKKMPAWLWVLLCVLLTAVVFLVGIVGWQAIRHRNDDVYTPERVADEFITYTYANDVESIFNLMPQALQDRCISDLCETYQLNAESADDLKQVYGRLKAPLAEYIGILDDQHGDSWTETHTVQEEPAFVYDETQTGDLEFEYIIQGVDESFKLEAAQIEAVDLALEAKNGSPGLHTTLHVPVIKVDGDWYLGQQIGELYLPYKEGITDAYGTLMDGFHMVGEFDSNRRRIYRNAEGYQILIDEDGRYYAEDGYGNIHYYEDAKGEKELEVTGPTGGEVLDESNYEAFWNAYWESVSEENAEESVSESSVSDNAVSSEEQSEEPEQ